MDKLQACSIHLEAPVSFSKLIRIRLEISEKVTISDSDSLLPTSNPANACVSQREQLCSILNSSRRAGLLAAAPDDELKYCNVFCLKVQGAYL